MLILQGSSYLADEEPESHSGQWLGQGLVTIGFGTRCEFWGSLWLQSSCYSCNSLNCVIFRVASLVLMSLLASTHLPKQIKWVDPISAHRGSTWWCIEWLSRSSTIWKQGSRLWLNPNSPTFLLSDLRQETSLLLVFISLFVKWG